jgi:hypothetical protein
VRIASTPTPRQAGAVPPLPFLTHFFGKALVFDHWPPRISWLANGDDGRQLAPLQPRQQLRSDSPDRCHVDVGMSAAEDHAALVYPASGTMSMGLPRACESRWGHQLSRPRILTPPSVLARDRVGESSDRVRRSHHPEDANTRRHRPLGPTISLSPEDGGGPSERNHAARVRPKIGTSSR